MFLKETAVPIIHIKREAVTSPFVHHIGAFPQTYGGIYYSNNTLANYILLQMQQSERRRQSDREHQKREEERWRHAEELQRFQRNSYIHSFIQETL